MRRPQDEFDGFVSEQCERLLRTVYLIVRDPATAEDVTQETLLRLARRWPRVRHMRHRNAYARRIAVNLALDECSARRREGEALERQGAVTAGAGAEEGERLEQRADLIAALGELSPRARAVIVLRYYGDLSEAQIAETLGCSVGTVKTTTSRALSKLRRQGGKIHAAR